MTVGGGQSLPEERIGVFYTTLYHLYAPSLVSLLLQGCIFSVFYDVFKDETGLENHVSILKVKFTCLISFFEGAVFLSLVWN